MQPDNPNPTVPATQISAPLSPPPSVALVTPNTSGEGAESIVPEQVKGFSWAGFLWTWIWGLGNKTYIGLLALIPVINFIVAIVLGIKGREWAWKNKKWESIEQFNEVQKKWVIWWLVICIPLTLIASFSFVFILVAINPQEQIKKANDLATRADLMQAFLSTEKFAANRQVLPWDNGFRVDDKKYYSSDDPFNELWFKEMVAENAVSPELNQRLLASKYTFKMTTVNINAVTYMFYCFKPQSDMLKLAAKASCKDIKSESIKDEVCLSDREYACLPDLKDPLVKDLSL